MIWLSWKLPPAVKQRPRLAPFLRHQVLRVEAFLQPRIVLLEGVAVHRIVQEEREVGVQVEQRPPHESVHFEDTPSVALLAVIDAGGARAHAPAARRIDVSEAVHAPRLHLVQRNLAGRIEVVRPAVEFESDAAVFRSPLREVAGDVVAGVPQRAEERTVGVGALVGHERVGMLQVGTVAEERAHRAERAALNARRELVGHALAQADVHHSQSAEISVLRAERTVDDVDLFHQFRAEALQRAQVALPVPLRRLVLLHVVHQHLEPAADAAVVEVETEAPDLERLAAALVLPGVDTRVEHVENLVVAREQGAVEDFGIAAVKRRFHGRCRDHDAGVNRRNDRFVFGRRGLLRDGNGACQKGNDGGEIGQDSLVLRTQES